MIQEFLGRAGSGLPAVAEERKISTSGGGGVERSSSSSPSSSDQQNLRCPRCDSSNTKFCYYNNYNLTQPRHFCKTCRRYWTKGGALRNVPIGGGCRKNKSTSISSSAGKFSSGRAAKTSATDAVGKLNCGPCGAESWADSTHSSQFLALLRATGPNRNPNSVLIKDEKLTIGSLTSSESPTATGSSDGLNLALDPLSQAPIGISNSLWRSIQQQQQQMIQKQTQQHSLFVGEASNTGFQDLYSRLRSATANFYDDQPTLAGTASSSPATLVEPAAIASPPSSQFGIGYWNASFPWTDLPTTNGVFP